MKFSSSLRDPVYGVVPITSIEQEILRLPILNRLKTIKQLGLAYLAFPGANHTRFEHSVGAMHVAYLMATALELDEHHIETVRIASLLHDVGHPPFSHSIEFASNLFGLSEIPDHKEATMEIIINSEPLKAILKRAKPLVHAENIAKLAIGKFTESMTLKCIIDGPIDADKIDYILRDNHHCGFPVALDINTISEILKKDANHGFVITPEGQSFAEQLFMGRYHLISKIHHNLKNRLGNYLLALSLKEAWSKTDKKEENAKVMSQIWTDMDLLAFLKENAKDTYPILANHLLGDETFHEICNFGYADMTPLARYSAAILSKYLSFIPVLSQAVGKWTTYEKLFLDVYVASPPEMTLAIGGDPTNYLIDTPLSKGALDASLKEIHVAVYSFEDVSKIDIDFDKLVKSYSKELDESLKEKADQLVKSCWGGDKTAFCLHKLIELELNRGVIKLRGDVEFPSDLVLLTANALYHSFYEVLGKVVSIVSLGELVKILRELRDKQFFQRSNGSPMAFYDIPISPSGGYNFPAQLLIDIEMLETFGLLYRLIKVQKWGERYTRKYQMRISGWGRGYYQKNLSNVQNLLSLFTRTKEHFSTVLTENKEHYEKYFEKVINEPTSRKIASEAKELGRELPIKVML